ncbi:hypothetical protein KOW79_005826 [Hemibagrus wyckioides]|uniref:Uncharacterized protein n=1 Tax=Hemibagrus wyckioides TaxID=337641 RepID=A0A9D3P076_9TELE|nr:hypothetical protein KOW79_005826 [Hemibagrus wyckioides]
MGETLERVLAELRLSVEGLRLILPSFRIDTRQEVYDNTAVFRQDPLQAIENAILSLNRSDNPFMEIEAAIRSINTEAGEREEEGGAAGHGRELREGEGGEEAEREVQVGGGVAGEGQEEAEREMRSGRDVSDERHQFRRIVDEQRGESEDARCLEDATRDPHGHLIVDLTLMCPDRYRLRTRLLPHQRSTMYVPKT